MSEILFFLLVSWQDVNLAEEGCGEAGRDVGEKEEKKKKRERERDERIPRMHLEQSREHKEQRKKKKKKRRQEALNAAYRRYHRSPVNEFHECLLPAQGHWSVNCEREQKHREGGRERESVTSCVSNFMRFCKIQ